MLVRTVVVFLLSAATAAGDDRSLKIVPSKALPAIESVSVYPSGGAKPLVTLTTFAAAVPLPGDGPFDVFVNPKGGIPVRVAAKLDVKAGATHDLKLGDLLGTVEVIPSDDSPRAGKVVVTAADDPGPDEKGHVAVQTGSDYRVELAVPGGFYAVWVVPASGARAVRVADRVRVLPGRAARVGGE